MSKYGQIIYDTPNTWHFIDPENKQTLNLEPQLKLFHEDIFDFKTNEIVESSTRSTLIPCILVLNGNKTFGRFTNGKLIYKCRPYHPFLPSFLIPYEIKDLPFSKIIPNMFVIIRFFEWTNKHPIGKIHQTIGAVDILENYYEYNLYCRKINASVSSFQKTINQNLKLKLPNNSSVSSNSSFIFTIDSISTTDFDDAFQISNDNTISIYISNVVFWMDEFDLWSSFSDRIATIYSPQQKKPMIPLSSQFCSLTQNEFRSVLKMDVFIDDGFIRDIQFSVTQIQVKKNFVYESPELLANSDYGRLLSVTRQLVKRYPLEHCNAIENSHDLVSYWMVFMNQHCGQKMKDCCQGGIFRVSGTHFFLNPNHHHNYYYEYSLIPSDYVHITCPIRRLVDLLNLIVFQKRIIGNAVSDCAIAFYEKWSQRIDHINTTMQNIAKFHSECRLMQLFFSFSNETIHYTGIMFQKKVFDSTLFQYMVYFPTIKITCRIRITDNIEEMSERSFQFVLFQNENTFHKKIRIQLIEK